MSSSLQAITTTRVYRKVAEQIVDRIEKAEFLPGDKLPSERDLSEQLQVSRASVREALIALELMGYVEVLAGVGVLVCARNPVQTSGAVISITATGCAASPEAASRTPMTASASSDIGPFDILETRLLLEPDAAALAAHIGVPEQIHAIVQAHARFHATEYPAEHDVAFHQAIARACGNAALESAIVHLWQLSLSSPVFARLQDHFVTHDVWRVAHQEHQRILDAICDRDPVRARHAMHDHLVGILARLRQDFGRSAL